jgi:hypothetical protein
MVLRYWNVYCYACNASDAEVLIRKVLFAVGRLFFALVSDGDKARDR